MTFHILISIISFALLWIFLKNSLSSHPRGIKYLMGMIFLLFPISFDGITSVSHIVFEITQDNILWYGVLFVVGYIFVWKYLIEYKKISRLNFFYVCILFLIHGFWYWLWITQSAYESWITPTIFTHPIILWHYISVQIYIITSFILILSIQKNKTSFSFLWKFILLLIFYFTIQASVWL